MIRPFLFSAIQEEGRREGRGGRLATGGEGRRKEGEEMWVKIWCALIKKKVFGSVLSPTCFVLFICPIRAPSWRPLLDKIVLFSRPRRVKENRFLANAIHPFWLCAHKNLSPKNPFSSRCFHFSFPGGRQWKNAPYTTPFTSPPKTPTPFFYYPRNLRDKWTLRRGEGREKHSLSPRRST